jgi:hypothetical protein
MDEEDALESWGWNSAKHAHYSQEVQEAVKSYYRAWAKCYINKRSNLYDTVCRQQGVQDGFHKIVQLRRKETGAPTYLPPDQYLKAIQSLETSDNA